MDGNPRTWDFNRAVYTIFMQEFVWQFSFVQSSVPDSKRVGVVPIRRPWAIITAWNPLGESCDRMSNEHRHRELEQLVQTRGLEAYRSVNCSPEGDWPEPGLAICGLGRAEALAIAQRFRQLAIIYACDDRTGLLDARTERWIVRSVFARSVPASSIAPPCRGSEIS